MTQAFLSYLLTSLIGTVSALTFLLIKPITKKCFSTSWHYYAWLAVLIVMMVPLRFNVKTVFPEDVKPAEEAQVAFVNSPEKEIDAVPENMAPIENEVVKPEAAVSEDLAKEKLPPKNVSTEKTADIMPRSELNRISFFESCKNIFRKNVNLFAGVWLLGMILLFIYKGVKYKVFLRNILKNSEKVHIDSLQAEEIEVRVMAGVKSPFVIRWLNPILVLPDKELPEPRMQNVLEHELTHIRRHDVLYKWIVATIKVVHWFNPFMYLIAKEIEKDCEISCDEVVAKNMNGEEKKTYADTILSFAFEYGRAMPLTTSMASSRNTLKGRLVAIKNSKRLSKANALVSGLVALVFFANFIAVSAFAGGALLPATAQMSSTAMLKIGDYITLGKYRGEDIVWRYVADDENGKLFWSDKFICEKPFGENDKWEDSALRAWLNSDEQFMNIEGESGYKNMENAYNYSCGFLYDSNFTQAEKSLFKEVSLRSVYLDDYWGLFTGKLASYGVNEHYWSEEDDANREYYLALESTMLKEKVFLPDLEQLFSVQKNMDVLGNCFTGVESMWDEADEESKYFTRTPLDGGYITGSHPLEAGYHERILTIENSVSDIYCDFTLDAYSHTVVNYFVRPAFYLNEENAIILSGAGTKEAPFVVDGSSAPNRFRENSLYGYKDNNGNVVIPPKYLKAGEFSENAALVILPENPNELRVITADGTYLFDKAFSAVNNFSSGYALVVATDEGEYSYINKNGELATELLFEYAENFDRGLSRVVLGGKGGVIDTNFNFYPDKIFTDYSVVKVLEGYKITFNSDGNAFFEKVYEKEPTAVEVKDGIYKLTYKNYYNRDTAEFVDVNNKRISKRVYSDVIYTDGEYVVTKSFSWKISVFDIFTGEEYVIERDFASDNTHFQISIKDKVVHMFYTQETGRFRYEVKEEYIPLTDDLKP